MITNEKLLEIAQAQKCRIGIGSKSETKTISESIKKCRSSGLGKIEIFPDSKSLIDALNKGLIDAVVRGNLPAKKFVDNIKSNYQIDELMRINLLQTADKKTFILAPVGIDEGSNVEQKIELIKRSTEWLKLFGDQEQIAILSGGRAEDLGRSLNVDQTIDDAERITEYLNNHGLKCKNFGILIEDAIKESNIIIVPDGIIGNFIFRTLYHLGNGDSIGAPILNVPDVIIDTSRTKNDYSSAIILAAAYFNKIGVEK